MQQSSTVIINWTTDYGIFRFLKGNRDLIPSKIKRLMDDVQNGLDLLRYCPILVNEDHYIIDGQHRFYVAQKLKRNIYYIVVPNITLGQIARLNNNQNRWKSQDFLNCFIDAGSRSADYKTLYDFIHDYKINISLAVRLLSSGTPQEGGSNAMHVFRDGEFEVTHLEESKALMAKAYEFHDFAEDYYSRAFLTALSKLLSNGIYDQQAMLDKLRKHDLKIEKCNNAKEYMQQLETLFNFRNSTRKPIY